MSHFVIQGAMEKRLAAMAPAIDTAWENVPFVPTDGVPYQRAFFIPNAPIDHGIAFDVKEWRGLFQVSLLYPLSSGRADAQQRAEQVCAHFAPLLTLTSSGMQVEVFESPAVAQGFIDENRWHVPVTVSWRAKAI